MKASSVYFKQKATSALANVTLQAALAKVQSRFVEERAHAFTELGEFKAYRDAATHIRAHTVAHLHHYLLQFEKEATRRGAKVHWATDASEANEIIAAIAREHSVKKIVKSKSMVTEECALNDYLETQGFKVVETDLGEYILQLAKEPPSHIVAPVVHKTKEEVSELFAHHHGQPKKMEIKELCREAREVLRPHFLSAGMGISGANFLVAETGSVAIVTNEGNGRLCTTRPRVHVAVTGIEKVVPTLEDLTTLLRVLTRSATGQAITNYVSMLTGARDPDAHDGPEHFHVVLVDNGRSGLLQSTLQPMLHCIRCGACMNHCPVYQSIGGHAYGWVYPGPMGSVLTPHFVGLENAYALPNASTFCGACAEVCPVGIPLPNLLRDLRSRAFSRKITSVGERLRLFFWSQFARRSWAYALVTRAAVRLLKVAAASRPSIAYWPGAAGWFRTRHLPRPEGKTFRELYRERYP